jgi:PQQ-dependent catabolism-associated CXXCW motif protein
MTAVRGILSLAICLIANCAPAMNVEVHGNRVFASGPVVDDLRLFEEAFAKPGIDTVVFVNSPGGDLWTGLRVGRLIADKGLKTVAAGSCISSCSIMFMGGRERRFSDAFRPNLTYVGIHGAHRTDTREVDASLQPQIFSFYKTMMGERFNATVMNQALYKMDDRSSLLRVFDPERSADKVPYHCRSSLSARSDCTDFKGENALSLGVITHRDLVKVNLPPAFQETPKVLGRELEVAIPSMSEMLAGIGQQKCRADSCKATLAKWTAAQEHKAIAARMEGAGIGLTWSRDTLINAMVGAVYQCNHLSGQPASLCEAQVVGGFDVRSFYQDADRGHKDALSRLTPPAEPFFANEEFGGAFAQAGGFRTQKTRDITPQKIDGIRTVGTQELARLIKSGQSPVVIDVGGADNEVIPGSVTLLFGGEAFDDPKKESEYNNRFRALLSAVSSDAGRPVAFYCRNRDCWLAVNASLRALKAGRTNVLWYRGGIESWKAAALPVAPIAIRAVVN